jgi:hypothetical protein
MDQQHSVAKVTSSLHESANDTGRIAFCGPVVLSAITGFPVSKVEAEIRRYRELMAGAAPAPGDLPPKDSKAIVRGTFTAEVEAALAAFGYNMVPKADFQHLERKARPTVWSWMQKPRNAWAHYILAIHKGKEGHWILIKGVKMCDTFTDGKWTFVCDGPHRGARIMEIFEVKKTIVF